MPRHVSTGYRIVAILILVAVASLYLGTSSAGAYNRGGAVAYADYWATSFNTGSWRHYLAYTNDCTNFISQTLFDGGGLPETWNDKNGNPVAYDSYWAWWWVPSYQTGSKTWTLAGQIMQHAYKWIGIYFQPQLYWSGLQPGDFYVMDLTGAGYPTHGRVWIGYGEIYNDNNQPTGTYGNVADQHTNPRIHTPWDSHWDPDHNPVYKIHVLG